MVHTLVTAGPSLVVTVGEPYCPTWTMMGFVLNVDGGRMQELDYVEVCTMEPRDKHTRGECKLSTKRGKAGTLQSMPTYEG
jgi:hypothetical protein